LIYFILLFYMEDKRTKDDKEQLKKLQKNLSKVRGYVEKLKKKTGSNKKIPISRLLKLYQKNYGKDDLFEEQAIGNVEFYADLASKYDKETFGGTKTTYLDFIISPSLKQALKDKKMTSREFIDFLINGGEMSDIRPPSMKKTKKKSKPSKEDEVRPASKPMSSKVDEIRPAASAVASKEDELRPASRPMSSKEDEVRPSSGTTTAKRKKTIEKKSSSKGRGPPAYCFTAKRLRDSEKGKKGQRYVVCVPGFV
jgi:hypothetical protein